METTVKTKWAIDAAHSEILFKVKHMMITNVKGEFRKFNAQVESDGNDFSDASVKISIDAASIFTNSDDRDAHLRSVDFFDVANYPEITFETTDLRMTGEETYKMTGLLKIKGISKEISLDVEFGGINKDPWGNEKAGFSLSGVFNRKDWGLTWNAALETGGVLVSDEVKMSAEVQLVKI
ncbi:MAG TPA: YceI family protein [Lentimicrobium sp.]|nr:YceI family protein [Lentimicrobium sp.]